jgi:hypothetical protein
LDASTELVIRGRELLAKKNLLKQIWRSLGVGFFINNLTNGNYTTEKELLKNLEWWAILFNMAFHTIQSTNVSIDILEYFVHIKLTLRV